MSMVVLVNSNRMKPAIAPLGLEYVAAALRDGGIDVEIVDLCLASDPDGCLAEFFVTHQPQLVGISFRNVDDCFLSSGRWFVPDLAALVSRFRTLTSAPIVLGGVGFSIFPKQIVEYTGAEFGIHGDGEQAIMLLLGELQGRRRFDRVPGLIWREDAVIRQNPPAWPQTLSLPTNRDAVDNVSYFRLGGQAGIETKRGCPRQCIHCADPLAKGPQVRLRNPVEIANEVESLLAQGVDVLHLCDSEFNIPASHAHAVCDELIHRSLGDRVRWYTYMAVAPFDAELAQRMRRAGCVGINFTGDAACEAMLRTYRQPYTPLDLASAVALCRANQIRVMIDLLLGGPGETPETLAQTIGFIKQIDPDCAGAALGVRIYPATRIAQMIAEQGDPSSNPAIRRCYDGPIDFLKPTYFISPALGEQPARLVRELIASDERFFPPPDSETVAAESAGDHNYNDNQALVEAIAKGECGAYWDILRRLRQR
jgi:radical SAM superfamily enzyme YgiQ (UPF0313 family)